MVESKLLKQHFREADIKASDIGTKQFINPTKLEIVSFIIFTISEKLTITIVTISIYSI